MSCIAGGFLPSEPQGSPLWWKSPGGHRKPNTAPEAYARVGKLSFVGCRRGRGKSHHGSSPCVQLSLDLFRSGPQDWSPGSRYLWALWHLWSVEGTEVAPFPWGQGSYPRKKCQLQRLQEKPVLPSLQRRLLTLKVCGSSPPRTVGWHFRDRQRDSLWPGEHQKVQWRAGMQEHRSQAQKSSGEGGSQGIGSVDHS